jgi:hypothetical protein
MGQSRSKRQEYEQQDTTDTQDHFAEEQTDQEEQKRLARVEQILNENRSTGTTRKLVIGFYLVSLLCIMLFFVCTLIISRMYYQSTVIFFANGICFVVLFVHIVLLITYLKGYSFHSRRIDNFATVAFTIPLLSIVSTLMLVTLISEQAGLSFFHMFNNLLPPFEQFGTFAMVFSTLIFVLCSVACQVLHYNEEIEVKSKDNVAIAKAIDEYYCRTVQHNSSNSDPIRDDGDDNNHPSNHKQYTVGDPPSTVTTILSPPPVSYQLPANVYTSTQPSAPPAVYPQSYPSIHDHHRHE